jgi:hypothetical protein
MKFPFKIVILTIFVSILFSNTLLATETDFVTIKGYTGEKIEGSFLIENNNEYDIKVTNLIAIGKDIGVNYEVVFLDKKFEIDSSESKRVYFYVQSLNKTNSQIEIIGELNLGDENNFFGRIPLAVVGIIVNEKEVLSNESEEEPLIYFTSLNNKKNPTFLEKVFEWISSI